MSPKQALEARVDALEKQLERVARFPAIKRMLDDADRMVKTMEMQKARSEFRAALLKMEPAERAEKILALPGTMEAGHLQTNDHALLIDLGRGLSAAQLRVLLEMAGANDDTGQRVQFALSEPIPTVAVKLTGTPGAPATITRSYIDAAQAAEIDRAGFETGRNSAGQHYMETIRDLWAGIENIMSKQAFDALNAVPQFAAAVAEVRDLPDDHPQTLREGACSR